MHGVPRVSGVTDQKVRAAGESTVEEHRAVDRLGAGTQRSRGALRRGCQRRDPGSRVPADHLGRGDPDEPVTEVREQFGGRFDRAHQRGGRVGNPGQIAESGVDSAQHRELTVRRACEIADGTDHPITGHEQARPSCVHEHPTPNTLTSVARDQGTTRGQGECA